MGTKVGARTTTPRGNSTIGMCAFAENLQCLVCLEICVIPAVFNRLEEISERIASPAIHVSFFCAHESPGRNVGEAS